MIKLSRLSIAFLLLFSSACSQSNDFDTLCSFYDSLENEINLDKMSAMEKFNYINTLVNNNLDSNSNARESWNAIINISADKRYHMFIEAAKTSSNKTWQCKSLQKHIKDLPSSN